MILSATVSLDQHPLEQQETLARMQRPVLGGQQQAQAIPFTPPTWYQPPTVTPSINLTNHSVTLGMGSPSETNMSTRLNSVVNQGVTRSFSPAPNAQLFDILPALQGKSLDELDLLLADSKVYNSFLHSLEPVRHLDSLRGELTKGHVDLARNNLTKDSQIAELRNQCAIIRTTELAAAREKFEEVQKREKEVTTNLSSSALVGRLQEAAAKVDEESEILHQKLLSGDIDLSEFIQKYKKERILYHRRMLIHFAVKASIGRSA